ncbi:MAG: AtpZ/AtpI family protein, partial [Bacilli bacterium]
MSQQNNKTVIKTIGLISALGTDLVVTTFAGVFLGRWLDTTFQTTPLFILLGTFIGLGAGIFGAYLL